MLFRLLRRFTKSGKGLSVFGLAAVTCISCPAQRILATFTTPPEARSENLQVPVSIALTPITDLNDSLLTLTEVSEGGKATAIPSQIDSDRRRRLNWIISPRPGKTIRTFQLIEKKSAPATIGGPVISRNENELIIKSGTRQLIQYNYKTVYPPEGIDTVFRRSGFIHPLRAPHGQILTRIQPPDHYHHYGIWNPWTHMLFEGDTLDLWNLNRKQGTVQFSKFLSFQQGDVFAEYSALHEHVSFSNGSERILLNEIQTVRVYRTDEPNYYIADLIISLNCATESPVRLLEYRYGGLGWRATEEWDRHNSEVLSSEGKTRKNADGTRAKWCIVQGKVGDDHAGILLMSHPENYNHPEPLRIWPENQYDRGDMFFNFSPTKNTDWLLEPGKSYVLKYRLLVFNGKFDKQKADEAWSHFAAPATVNITR